MVYGDIDAIVREDEGGVGGCQLGGRHCVLSFVVVGLNLKVEDLCAMRCLSRFWSVRGGLLLGV